MWVIAHRGASGAAPENTLAAFRRAVEEGAGFVETDLQLTRDARLVALHDKTLNRTTNGRGPVSAKTLEELRSLDAGAWFGRSSPDGKRQESEKERFAGERVPTVEEVLAFGRQHDIGLYLELKPLRPGGAEQAVVGALRASREIARSVVLSFDPGSLVELHRLEPLLVTGFLYRNALRDGVDRAVEAGARQLLPRADRVTPELVAEAHRRDLKVVAWTVNDPKRMQAMRNAGVDGIITNYPGELAALLSGK
jgi:glycerophosphoryl diester phosphodiesterase